MPYNKSLEKIGMKFNSWTVIGLGRKSAYYKCKCECGNESEVSITNLKKGYSRSCHHCSIVRMRENAGMGTGPIDARSEDMISLKNEGWTLKKIGEKYGITRERVRQILKACNFQEPKDTIPPAYKKRIEDQGYVIADYAKTGTGRNRIKVFCENGHERVWQHGVKTSDCLQCISNRLTGEKFGKWTVVGPGKKHVHSLCKCECGVVKEVKRYHLEAGRSNACNKCATRERNQTHSYYQNGCQSDYSIALVESTIKRLEGMGWTYIDRVSDGKRAKKYKMKCANGHIRIAYSNNFTATCGPCTRENRDLI